MLPQSIPTLCVKIMYDVRHAMHQACPIWNIIHCYFIVHCHLFHVMCVNITHVSITDDLLSYTNKYHVKNNKTKFKLLKLNFPPLQVSCENDYL